MLLMYALLKASPPCPLVGDRILMSEVLDAATQFSTIEAASYDKVFSNAAMHVSYDFLIAEYPTY